MQKSFYRRQHQHTHPTPRSSKACRGIPPLQRPPKVVSVPVRRVSKQVAAKWIQKAFRGFLVRRNVKKIAGMKKQVDEIEAKLSVEETMDLIRKDGQERLKVNESLMSLLLRLDSVRSCDWGVRDFRKSVIKKVIVLQEKLDTIISEGEDVGNQIEQIKYSIEPTQNQMDSNYVERMEGEGEKEEPSGVAEQEESVEKEAVKEATKEEAVGTDGSMQMEKRGGDERKLEVMERMTEKNDNPMLIGIVRELCEKNKTQTEIINSLLKRVDILEKSFKKFKVNENKANNTNS